MKTSLLAGDKHPQFDFEEQRLTDFFSNCKDNLTEECINESSEQLIELENRSQERVGWKLDMANAYVFNASNDNFDELDLARIGVWLTASYQGVSFDSIAERVTNNSCQENVVASFSAYKEDNLDLGFSDEEIAVASKNYNCIRYPDSNKIVFFGNSIAQTEASKTPAELVSVLEYCENQESICVTQSGLSASRIVDRQNSVSDSAKAALAMCNKNLEPQMIDPRFPDRKKSPFALAQKRHYDAMNDLNNNVGTNGAVVTDEALLDEAEIAERYQCQTQTGSQETKAFLINSDSIISDPSQDEECQAAINQFIADNGSLDANNYTCANFSWVDLEIEVETSNLETDDNCDRRIEDEVFPKSEVSEENDIAEDNADIDPVKLNLVYQCLNKPNNFTILGIGRYINNQDDSGQDGDNYDLGISINWQPSEQSRLKLLGEYIRRFGEESDDRFVGGIRYRFTDNYEVFTSVGKAFDDGFSSNNLVSIIGIDIGLGQSTLPSEKKNADE